MGIDSVVYEYATNNITVVKGFTGESVEEDCSTTSNGITVCEIGIINVGIGTFTKDCTSTTILHIISCRFIKCICHIEGGIGDICIVSFNINGTTVSSSIIHVEMRT